MHDGPILPPIETLHSPSLDEFRAACRRKQGLFKMTGVVDHWAARERWNPEYFRKILGDKEITATSSEGRSYSRPIYETLTGDEYMDIVEGKTHRKEQVYLAGLSSDHHPELDGDYERPPWVAPEIELRIFYWP